jgi:CubicO group peptidase (beta-lactamase class C family)
VVVGQNGKAITSGARGKADRETESTTRSTRFRIGSMNKMFTAVATLQLVERGKLSLDDTIGRSAIIRTPMWRPR